MLFGTTIFSLAVHLAVGKILTSHQELEDPNKYDFVVVGGARLLFSLSCDYHVQRCHSGGPGGCALANRLSEELNFSVLLVEAGGLWVYFLVSCLAFAKRLFSHRNDDILEIQVPSLSSRLSPNTPFDWNFTTTEQLHLNNCSLAYPRGYGLGGTSAISTLGRLKGP